MGSLGKTAALAALAGLCLIPRATATETNLWPAWVEQVGDPFGRDDHRASLGPVYSETQRGHTRILSVRPFWTSFEHDETGAYSAHFLYPWINYRKDGPLTTINIFALSQSRRNEDTGSYYYQSFPFIFYYDTPKTDDSYFAVWPFGGTLRNRFWRDRITFALWPLYIRTERGDETRLHFPWPFVRTLSGPRSRGFGLWPLYGQEAREGDYSRRFLLWPLHYHYRDNLSGPVPYVRFAVLPLYQRETAAGMRSGTFVWPFFGYTRESDPRPEYSENRYFWPLLVQGRGEERTVNRWMPLYTHETSPGREKRWYLWPLLKTERREQEGLVRERESVLFFVWRDERQHFSGKTARLASLWPVASYWQDGAGRRQAQLLDPFTVFFPGNQKMKENWSPLFALYRYDARGGSGRHSVLWDLLVWERDGAGLRALQLGPLYQWTRGADAEAGAPEKPEEELRGTHIRRMGKSWREDSAR